MEGFNVRRTLMVATTPLVSALNRNMRKGSVEKEILPASEETNTVPSEDGLVTLEELGTIFEKAEAACERREKEFDLEKNIQLLDAVAKSCHEGTEDLLDVTAKYKGLYEAGKAEERITWSMVVQAAVELKKTYMGMRKGKTRKPAKRGDHPSGRKLAYVFPETTYEHALFAGVEQVVWFPEGQEPEQQTFDKMHKPRVAALLASGNQTPQVGGDILHVVFSENAICVCKLNPVNDYLYAALRKSMQPLIDEGLLYLVNGGIDVSQAMCWAKVVDVIHMTGSDKTYDAIMWGPTPQAMIDGLPEYCEKPQASDAGGDWAGYIAKRKASGGKMNLDKPFMAELGNITPVIVTPAKWTAKEIDFHAKNLVAGKIHNAGFNCLSPQIVITDARWDQRTEFLDAVKKYLAEAAPRSAYYPGAKGRRDEYVKQYEGEADVFFEEHNEASEDSVPFTLISGLDSDNFDRKSHAACVEMFGPLLTEMPLKLPETTDLLAKDFLPAAVKITSDVLWGNLCGYIIVHPDTKKKLPKAVEQAIVDFKYGSVGVNSVSLLLYGLSRGTWGGHAGLSSPEDIQSGNGFVHNTLLYSNAEKTVVTSPFMAAFTPVWMPDNRNIEAVSKRMNDFWINPTASSCRALISAGLRG